MHKNIKKKSFLGNFRINTLRSKIIATILIFALVGGVWQTFRSFAGSRVVECKASNCLNAKTLGINAFNANDPSKNNMPIYILKKNGQAYTTPKRVLFNRNYDVCAIVYGSGSFKLRASIRDGYVLGKDTTATSNPTAFCTSIATINGRIYQFLGSNYVDLSGSVTSLSGSDIKVSVIYIDNR